MKTFRRKTFNYLVVYLKRYNKKKLNYNNVQLDLDY